MRLIYVLLSPTFGMHQYTADLANRATEGAFALPSGSNNGQPDVHLVTTNGFPADRYSPAVEIHTPLTTRTTGFSAEGAKLPELQRTIETIRRLAHQDPAPVVHITGVHLWNARLVQALRKSGIPVIHTLHDLSAHTGVRFGSLIPRWNRLVIAAGAHILVHGRCYRQQLLDSGLSPERVSYAPLLHGFWGFGMNPLPVAARDLYSRELDRESRLWKTERDPLVLFFGRVERYKGVDTLFAAWSQFGYALPKATLVVAGAWAPDIEMPTDLPNVVIHNRRIADDEAIGLFRSASLLVLPYRDATQSALIAAGYQFGLPAIVSDTGALPEYVVDGQTGWVFPTGDPVVLATLLRQALTNPVCLSEMGAAGRVWYSEQRGVEIEIMQRLYRSQAARSLK